MDDEELLFADSDENDFTDELVSDTIKWKILIVDDEPEIHQITKLALVDFIFSNKELNFLHAYSANEAKKILLDNSDIALVLLDVVMENNHAGLDLVMYIREEINNNSIRIVLRTGQPGAAPERDVIANYDINDYVQKSELSAQKLFSTVISSLRAYASIVKLEKSRKELYTLNQTLAQEHQRIKITLNSIGDAVITTDSKANITHLNPVAEELTGWSLKDAKNLPLKIVFNIVNLYTRETVDNPVNEVLSTGKIVELSNHTVLIRKDKKEYQIADSAAPIKDETGKIIGVILVCRNITRAYQIEEALRRSQKMEAIGQLSGGIAHDFNNQLGIVIGYLDFLETEFKIGDKQHKWVNIATKATLRCMDLTRQLLAFSRTQVKEKTILNLNASVKELETMITRSITPEVEFEYFLDDDLWLTELDPGDLQDAILNLTINARDAMPNGGKLIIETTNKHLDIDYTTVNPDAKVGDYIQLSISDTGVGMDKICKERLFEPFYTTKAKGKGTGLGMAMVYGFVKRFNGFIKVYSEVNLGTTISLYFQKSNSKEVSNQTNIVAIDIPKGDERILVVDDELDLLKLSNQHLIDLGYKTHTALNASEALKILEKHSDIDLLFSDVVMPGGINGYELAKKAIQKHPKLKVLLTSGFTSKAMMENGEAKFSTNLLNKPYRKIELATRIRLILDKDNKSE